MPVGDAVAVAGPFASENEKSVETSHDAMGTFCVFSFNVVFHTDNTLNTSQT